MTLVVLAFLAAGTLLVGGWLVWSFVRPSPTGFPPTTGEALRVGAEQPSVLQYTIDARSRTNWAYFDFSSGSRVSTSQDNPDWDLAFRRTDVLTNGGESNPAGRGGAIDLGEVGLLEAGPPAEGYLVDATDEERGLENPELHKWYSYNWIKHIITSKNHTYAIRTATGELALFTVLSYYCDDGSAACITFQYVYPVEADSDPIADAKR